MVKRSPFKSLPTILFTLYAAQIAMAEPENPQVLRSADGAVGALDDLPAHRARAFEATGHFDPLPPPRPGDWLTEHPEPGQTFEQFLQARPQQPDARRQKLYLLPLGEFPPHRSPAIGRLREFAAAFFSLEVILLPPLDLDTAAIEGRRNPYTGQFQLDARAVLRLLRRRLPADAFALLGITMVDLYPDPTWNFVFGLASPSDHVGVFSFARYDPGLYGETVPAAARFQQEGWPRRGIGVAGEAPEVRGGLLTLPSSNRIFSDRIPPACADCPTGAGPHRGATEPRLS
jgi:archaemetzincin